MTTGERIRALRKDLKISADDLANAIGVDRSTIFRYENGDIEKLPISALEPISKALSTSAAYLLGWTDGNSDQMHDITYSQNLCEALNNKSYINMSWLDKLNKIKKDSGKTIEEIAILSGVPKGTLNKLFAGQTKDPQLSTLKAVVHAFGKTLDDLDDMICSENQSQNSISDSDDNEYIDITSIGQITMSQLIYDSIKKNYKSQSEFSRIAGIPLSTLRSILQNGLNSATVGNARKIFSVLDLPTDIFSPNWLFDPNMNVKSDQSINDNDSYNKKSPVDILDEDENEAIELLRKLTGRQKTLAVGELRRIVRDAEAAELAAKQITDNLA